VNMSSHVIYGVRSKKNKKVTVELRGLVGRTFEASLYEPQSMGEPTTIAVHRCRFVDYNPSAITALAFPPLPLPSVKGKNIPGENRPPKFGTLAVGHANGNIDLCEWAGHERDSQCTQAWVVRKVGLSIRIGKSRLITRAVDSIWFSSVQGRFHCLRDASSR
jgi:hypothetical protein